MPRTSTLALTLPGLLFLTLETSVQAETIYGITAANRGNQVFSFESTTPGTLLTLHEVTGFVGNPSNDESIGGIDIRPANGKLYGVSQNGHVYTVDPETGIATLASILSSTQPLPSFLSVSGIDFDPVVDRLRVVTLDRGNFSVNVDTGETVVVAHCTSPQATYRRIRLRSALLMATTLRLR
jgi:outer membrane protein assembly factor BamB